MPIDFHLSPSETAVREAAAGLARHVLEPARAEYMTHNDQESRFQATRPAYAAAAAGGAIKGMITPAIPGGKGGSIVETTILVEECYAIEPSCALTIFSTGLGLMPFNIIGSALPESSRRFLDPFLEDAGQAAVENSEEAPSTSNSIQPHAPIASLVFSEPGGVANFLERGAPGLNTTARRDGDEWVIDGEKLWATNSAGWDFKGADVACVVCRDATDNDLTNDDAADADPRDKIMVIVVTRADLDRNGPDSFRVLRHVSTPGHTSVSGPHIRYTSVRVPSTNVLVTGKEAVQIIFGAFDWTAVLVGAQAVGLMRAAFDAALAFAKKDNRRGKVPLLERQAFADLLSGVKMATEACRALTWKAAHAMEHGPGDYDARRELALSAKVYCSEAAVKAIMDTIHAVGITAYDADQPFARLLNDAIALPIFDGGNVGIRKRHLQQLMLAPTYDPWVATFGSV